ncbi:MAG: hypothetical protein C0519_00555 [Hyphomicrobium sp.]|nr:hypothetical protein [Hyphomicrobium sp.]PPD08021.1 MAG: hypothetical protein CTY28_07005 [Hyphomicrobium sp.]
MSNEDEEKMLRMTYAPKGRGQPKIQVRVPEEMMHQLMSGNEEPQDLARDILFIGSWVATCPSTGPRLWTITAPEGMDLPPELQGSFAGRESTRVAIEQYLSGHPELRNVVVEG